MCAHRTLAVDEADDFEPGEGAAVTFTDPGQIARWRLQRARRGSVSSSVSAVTRSAVRLEELSTPYAQRLRLVRPTVDREERRQQPEERASPQRPEHRVVLMLPPHTSTEAGWRRRTAGSTTKVDRSYSV